MNQNVNPSEIDKAAIPLHIKAWELYARERALLQSPQIAAKLAGYDVRNCALLERKPAVQARIAHLSRQDTELFKQKRDRLESKLWDWMNVDRSEYYETVEIVVTDRNGQPICDKYGRPRIRTVNQLKPLEKLTDLQRSLIESITYTESGKPNLKLVSKQYCHSELRKMIGGDAQPDVIVQEWQGLSDREFFSQLAQMAYELGFDQAQRDMSATRDAKPLIEQDK